MVAEDILRFALYKEVLKRQRRKKRKLNHGGAASDSSDESGDEEEAAPARMEAGQQQEKGKDPEQAPVPDPVWGEESQDVEMEVDGVPQPAEPTAQGGNITPQRCAKHFHSLDPSFERNGD